MWIRGGMGAREVYSSVDQTKKVKTKKRKGLQYKNFHKFWLLSQNSCDFPRILKWRPQKKEVFGPKRFMKSCLSPQKLRKKQFLLTNSRAVNTILGVFGLDLHSSSPEPVNFFGAQSSLGGGNFLLGGASSHLGGHGPGMHPRGAGLDETFLFWKTLQSAQSYQFCRELCNCLTNKCFDKMITKV